MTMIANRIRRLTKTVPNPNFDGRRRYGLESVCEFKEGVKLRLTAPEPECYCPASVELMNPQRYGPIPRDLYQALLDASEEFEPKRWAEIELAVGYAGKWVANEVLDRLMQLGVVSAPDLLAHAIAVVEAPEPEEAAS